MSNPFQGFEKIKNLEENLLDRDALNNLGSTPIGDDINLLKNNKRNISSITVSSQNINVSSSTIFFTNRDVVFSERTKIIVNSNVFYVKNSNGKNSFQLSLNEDLQSTVAGANLPIGAYIRSDEITKNNFINFSPRRRPPIEGGTDNQATAGAASAGEAPLTTSVKNTIRNYESKIDEFISVQNNSIRRNASFLGNNNLETEGFCLIADPDNFNSSGLSNTGPGLFIYNPDTNSGVRAFSSNENVWQPNLANTYLETSSTRITVGNLFMSKEIVLEGRSGSLISQSVTTADISLSETNSVFTHKVPIEINGETYFLCLTNT